MWSNGVSIYYKYIHLIQCNEDYPIETSMLWAQFTPLSQHEESNKHNFIAIVISSMHFNFIYV